MTCTISGVQVWVDFLAKVSIFEKSPRYQLLGQVVLLNLTVGVIRVVFMVFAIAHLLHESRWHLSRMNRKIFACERI
jgi:hypothetical protein